jgi:predicted metalloendopeptidase
MLLSRFSRLCVVLFVLLVTGCAGVFAGLPSDGQEDVDRAVRPGDDFYRFANGGWLKTATIPPGQSSFDTRAILNQRNNQRVRNLILAASVQHAPKGTVAQKVGDYYSSFINADEIEAKGLTPLSDELHRIDGIADKTTLSAYLGSTLNTEIDGLITNADHVFGLYVSQGFSDSRRNYPHLLQGGLGLQDRESYLDSSSKMVERRTQYQAHIAAMLKLTGTADSDLKAAQILTLETKIARAFAADADAADVFKQNNPWKRSDFDGKAPGMDWKSYFKAAGLAEQMDFIVWQPTAVTGVSVLVKSESLETWKAYLRFHLIEHYAGVLPKALAAEHLKFVGTPQDRETAAVTATNGALGQAVGQLYTHQYFPPEAKAKAQAMVRDIVAAYRSRISNLRWLQPQTKEKALVKLNALVVGVGYPDKWIDYSTLEVVRRDAFGNMQRAEAFQRSRNLAQLKQPVDPGEWRIDPQIVGAIIMFSPNAEFFSAGILQPPYFDPQGDTASNYGSAGAGMAHEISHSFDELGNIYDAEGRLGLWWTAEDAAQYHAAGEKLASQFSAYCPLAGVCINGKRVLGENIADLAGLVVAHDAYILSLKGQPDVPVNGLSGEERFFLAFAQRWRKLQSEDALRKQVMSDTHAPGEYRSDTVRNVDAWYEAYKVTSGAKLYLKPEDRVGIW